MKLAPICTIASALFAFLAAGFWFWSAAPDASFPDTILIGDDGVNWTEPLKRQAARNRVAAICAGISAALGGLSVLLPT